MRWCLLCGHREFASSRTGTGGASGCDAFVKAAIDLALTGIKPAPGG